MTCVMCVCHHRGRRFLGSSLKYWLLSGIRKKQRGMLQADAGRWAGQCPAPQLSVPTEFTHAGQGGLSSEKSLQEMSYLPRRGAETVSNEAQPPSRSCSGLWEAEEPQQEERGARGGTAGAGWLWSAGLAGSGLGREAGEGKEGSRS